MLNLPAVGREPVEAAVFRTDPEVTAAVCADLPYGISGNGPAVIHGEKLFKKRVGLRIMVDAPEICACPNAVFLVLGKRVYSIVRQGPGVAALFPQHIARCCSV